MSKSILIISTSLRKDSNSDILADEFAKGALDAGNTVEKINLGDKKIEFCRGCLACQQTKKCVINDDVEEIIQKMKYADVLVFATPIYYYEMSGQMKTMLDRANPLFTDDYNFKEVYFIATAAEDGENVLNNAVNGLKGWIDCFPKSQLAGVIFGGGVTGTGEIRNHIEIKNAYNMGKDIS